MTVKLLSHVLLSVTPWTTAHQSPLFFGFFRQEDWSGVPLNAKVVGMTWKYVQGKMRNFQELNHRVDTDLVTGNELEK